MKQEIFLTQFSLQLLFLYLSSHLGFFHKFFKLGIFLIFFSSRTCSSCGVRAPSFYSPTAQVLVPDEKCYCGAELNSGELTCRWTTGYDSSRSSDSSSDKKKKGWGYFTSLFISANFIGLVKLQHTG